MKVTYQTRIETDPAAGRALSAYARSYGHVERRLFAAAAAGEPFTALKRGCLAQHGISSRLFNSVKAVELQLRQGTGVFRVPRPAPGCGDSSRQPGLQFSHRSGEVHGAVWAQCAPGSGPGAGPQIAWLFRAHSAPTGSPCRQWRPCRLPRTREEAREARMDVLGCGLGTVETGACSASPAGDVERGPQSDSGIRVGISLRG